MTASSTRTSSKLNSKDDKHHRPRNDAMSALSKMYRKGRRARGAARDGTRRPIALHKRNANLGFVLALLQLLVLGRSHQPAHESGAPARRGGGGEQCRAANHDSAWT